MTILETPRSQVTLIATLTGMALLTFVLLGFFDRYREAGIDHTKACTYAFSSLCAVPEERANSRNTCDYEELACQQSVWWHAIRRTLREMGPMLLVILSAMIMVLGYVYQLTGRTRLHLDSGLPFTDRKKTTRGVSADVVIIDEAAFIDTNVVYNVILPLFTVKNTALLMVSSPQDRQNFFSKLVNLEINGEPVCNKLDLSQEEFERPPWLSSGKVDVTRALYGNNQAMATRELDGEIADDENAAFSTEVINSFQNGPLMEVPRYFDKIYMFVDPQGYGTSHFGIMSYMMVGETYLFVGGESHNIKTMDEKEKLLNAHVDQLCRIPGFNKYGKIHLFTETNLGMEAGSVAHLLKGHKNVEVVYGASKNYVPGVLTTSQNKKLYYQMMQIKLKEGKARFWTNFFSTNPFLEGHPTFEEAGKLVKDMLFEQTSRAIAKPTLSESGVPGLVYGAKFTADGKKQEAFNDDVFMCFNMALFHGNVFMKTQVKRVAMSAG